MRTQWIFVLFLAVGCSTTPSENGQFNSKELIGDWVYKDDTQVFYEHWEEVEKGLQGTGFVLDQGDTIMIETAQIAKRGNELVYSVKVNNQNKGEVVDFVEKASSEKVLILENMDHDFPQIIEYNLQKEDKLTVTISGEEDGNFRKTEFKFSRLD
ncbi:MAG: hypothetical protein HRT74_08495 [Flavobacteriales bacterium]|nr:hypothetical protein [Flavobacteriales bacterium]